MTVWVSQGTGSCADRLKIDIIENCNYIEVLKTADVTTVDEAGDIIHYTITVSNLSVVSVINIVVTDPLLGGVLAGPISGDTNSNGILEPSETWIYTGNYAVTQNDIDTNGTNNDGDIDNCVTVTGNSSVSNTLFTQTDCVEVFIDYSNNGLPVFSVTKEANIDEVSQPGEIITYTITVTNTSNFAISNIVINDPLLDNEHYVSGDIDGDNKLDLNEIWIFQGTYTVTLDDLLSLGIDYFGNADGDGDIDNTVFVNGTSPNNANVSESASEIVLVEFIYIPDGFSPDGDDINEEFEIIGLVEQYPKFTIRIYNRWGNMVYDYDNNGSTDPQWWNGISDGRVTINKGLKVPTGTYYYVIDFNDGIRVPLVDWIYITRKND
jgi:gliding motility-associated-like protein/uncharacterized repeat protein (TIGR01451 family)